MDGDCPGDGDRPTITCRSYVCELSQLTNSQPPTTLPAGVLNVCGGGGGGCWVCKPILVISRMGLQIEK